MAVLVKNLFLNMVVYEERGFFKTFCNLVVF